MAIVLERPAVDGLSAALAALREWQREDVPMQLHPGDLGWQWRLGAEATAAAIRTWGRDGEVLALGFLDAPAVLRLAIAPAAQRDEQLAHRLGEDIAEPQRGVLPDGRVALEVAGNAVVREVLAARGWVTDEPWTQLSLDLSGTLPEHSLRIEVAGPGRAQQRAAVQRAAFESSTFDEDRWRAMAAGPLYADARCLLGYDERGRAVAAATVWSSGPGKPGLLEPLGVHRDHRGHGHGTAISVAAAAALQQMGASSARVCTPSANVVAVATYRSAGFRTVAEAWDLTRPVVSTTT